MKKYICSWCNKEQLFKDSQLKRKPLQDRMATGLYGLCNFCNKIKLMIPIEDSK